MLHGDLYEPLAALPGCCATGSGAGAVKFDAVLANPPFVAVPKFLERLGGAPCNWVLNSLHSLAFLRYSAL